jgi:exonuclease SbcC
MKILKVTVAGFGPFKTEQVIDFNDFEKEGLFLIVGETGAGKSSILDAITYALYGNTPRWTDTTIIKKHTSVRSDYSAPDENTKVELEFSEGDDLFKIVRSIKLTKGSGVETEDCNLYQWLNNDWKGQASKPKAVGEVITKLIGLTEQEFLQVILLAQGRFDKALKASSEERLKLMRSLFKTGRFETYKNRLKVIADTASSKLNEAQAGIRTEQNVLASALALDQDLNIDFERDVPAAISKLKDDLVQVDVDKKAADDALTTATSTLESAKAQTERNSALATLEALKKLEPEMVALQKQVDAANRAAKVEALIRHWQDAESTKSDADQKLADARKGFAYETKDSQLKVRRDKLVALQAKLEENIELEDTLFELNKSSSELTDELKALNAELSTLKQEIETLKAERLSLQGLAAEVDPRTSIRDAAKTIFDKSEELQEASKKLETLKEDEKAASKQAEITAAAYGFVLKAYNDLAAARLAEILKPGEACLVCGSTTHPAKHSSVSQDAVDETTLEAANKASQTAIAQFATSTEQLKSGQDAVADLQKIVGDQMHSAVEAALSKANADLVTAEEAQLRVNEIASQIDGDDAPLVKKRDEVGGKVTETKTALAAADQELKRVNDELKAILAGQPSVSVYLEATKDELAKTEVLTSAIEAADSASKNVTKAIKSAESKASEQKFDSLDHVLDASLESTVLEGFQTRIDEHKKGIASQKGILELPRLKNLPKDLPSQEIAEQSVGAALASASAIAEVAGGLREKINNAEDLFGKILAQVAELSAISSDAELKTRLYQTVDGKGPNTKFMGLEVYFMAAELESVLEAANLRLKTLSRGRFSLMHTDQGVGRANTQAGLGIEVMDENTGKPFDPHRFSGGETFLASLSLALGLAEVVTSRNGGIKIDTLFVDEGFGSLSGEALEDAMSILESLKSGGRTVGLISHVESMKERIPTQLKVNKTPNGPSTISV